MPTITVTAPTGSGSYAQGSSVTAAWTVDPTVADGGEFDVSAVSSTGAWYLFNAVAAHGGSANYTHNLPLDVPAAGGYQLVVSYRPTAGSGSWTAYGISPGTFAVVPPVTFDGLNLNDCSLYFRMQGFNPGESEVTFDEFVSYAGGVGVANVQPSHVVQLMLPIDVRGTSEATMLAGVAAINVKIAACSYVAPKSLVVGGSTYSIIASTQLRPVRDELYEVNVARLAITLNRMP